MAKKKTLLQQYMEKFGEPIALYEVMGSEIFIEKFQREPDAVYDYCLEKNITWREALEAPFDPDVLY